MPYNYKYRPSDIRRLLELYSSREHSELESSKEHEGPGGVRIKSPYIHRVTDAFILDAATDKEDKKLQKLLTIEQIFLEELKPKLTDVNKDNVIIIPVTEEQKIFALFPRNHWVTLHYDPKENKATIIDSRPWYISIFYPTSSAKKSLQAGIKAVYTDGDEKAKNLSFNSVYQGVQHNDTHCGAWTTRNILDLATCKERSTAVKHQLTKYKSEDELDVVNNIIKDINKIPGSNEELLIKKPSLAQRFLAFLGFRVQTSTLSARIEGSTNRIASALKGGYSNPVTTNSDSDWDTLEQIPLNQIEPDLDRDIVKNRKEGKGLDHDSGHGSDEGEKESIGSITP